MVVQIEKSGMWYTKGAEYNVRIMRKEDVCRIPNGLSKRMGDWYVEEIPFKQRLIKRSDCVWMNVEEYGKEKKYKGSESKLQKVTMDYLKVQKFFGVHVPNEGKRSARRGAKLKREGMYPSFPDVLIFEPALNYCGVAIELKADGGKVEEEQIRCLQRLYSKGWYVGLCWNLEGVIRMLKNVKLI